MQFDQVPSHSIKQEIHQNWLENSGKRIPFGCGCAWLGRGYPDRQEVKDRLLTLETAYDFGFRYFDTARAYGDSEWVVGEFISTIERKSIFLATKLNLPKKDNPRQAAEQARGFLNESLMRLKTEYLDLYQIHDSSHMGLVFSDGGVLDFLLEAKRQGLIRHIGMAFRNQEILERALQHEAFDTILTWGDFSPFNQSAAGLIERAFQRKAGVINASPLYEACWRGLDLGDPRILSAVLHYPVSNPGIDITLTGPANKAEIQSTVQALLATPDRLLWEDWKNPKEPLPE